ncbi:MAG TPA: BON domain-containing protein [Candidatus Acidoferrales bacterium]|jgi:osmotically-inducible protein OsmY|nr:BON domain-containing protein [Candidatus Acidoferrales bacterium]
MSQNRRQGNKILWVLLAGVLLVAPLALSRPVATWLSAAQVAPDNSKQNQDRNAPTADQQKTDKSDRLMTQKIRKSIMADKSLSTYAHNVKVISQNGKVTLRGPVHSEQEKATVESKAADVAGKDNVTSYIDVVAK